MSHDTDRAVFGLEFGRGQLTGQIWNNDAALTTPGQTSVDQARRDSRS